MINGAMRKIAPWVLILIAVSIIGAQETWAYFIPLVDSHQSDVERFNLPIGSTEDISLRTVGSSTYIRPDGLRTTVTYSGINHQDRNGNIERSTLAFNSIDTSATNALVQGNNLKLESLDGKGITWHLPRSRRTINGNTLTYTDNGVGWTYTKLNDGVKLEGVVSEARGSQTYTFPYTAREDLVLATNGGVLGDGFEIPPATVTDADGATSTYGWALTRETISVTFNDADLALPYVIDPTTVFPVSTGTDDGYTTGQTTSYPPPCIAVDTGQTAQSMTKTVFGSTYISNVSYVRWDTSVIGVTSAVTGAEFNFEFSSSSTDANARNLNAEWYSSSNWPIDCADHTDAVGTTAFTEDITTLSSPVTLGTLTSINQTGYTGMRLGVSGGVPTGNNWVLFHTSESTTGTELQLSVTYEVMVVTSVDNTPVAANGTKSFTMTGNVLTGVTAVRLEKSGESNINCTSISVTDDEHVDFDCNLTGAASGAWDVVAVKAAGSATGTGILDIHALTIFSVIPTSDTPTASTAFTMDGDGLDTGIQAKLTKSGESDINCTGEAVTLPLSRMTADCDLTGVAEGFWNMVLTNTDTTSVTLLNATFISSSLILQATGVADGEHTLKLESDGTDVFLYLDNVIVDSTYFQWAMQFNGATGDVDIGSPATLDNVFAGGGTVEAWIDAESDGEGNDGYILNKGEWGLRVSQEDFATTGFMRVVFYKTFTGATGSWDSAFSAIAAGVDYHIAVTYDQASAANDPLLYINGVAATFFEGVAPSGTAVTDAGTSLIIGNNQADSRTFNGTIDDVRIWGDIRSPAEISANYGDKLIGTETDLEGYWPIDIGTGALLDDDTANNNNGTITTATWKKINNLAMDSDSPSHNPPVVNANDWEMFTNNAMPAVEYVKITLASVLNLWYEFNTLPGLLLVDRSGEDNDTIARYPDTDDSLSIEVGSMQVTSPIVAESVPGEVLGPAPEINSFSDTPTSSTGGFFIFDMLSDVMGFPYQASVAMLAIGVTIMFGIISARIFKEALPVGISVVLSLVIFWQMGALPFWMPVLFSIGPLIFFLIWKKATP